MEPLGVDKVDGLSLVSREMFLRAALGKSRVVPIFAVEPAKNFLSDVLIERIHDLSQQHQLIARPCPVVPRHGFVASRIIESRNDIVKLAKEVIAEEKDAWIMVNPFIAASRSVVMTEAMTAISLGHDGATSGKRTVALPLLLKFPDALRQRCLEIVGGDEQDSYTIVQAKLVGDEVCEIMSENYIPELLTVGEVLSADSYSDLEWEKYTQGLDPVIDRKPDLCQPPKYRVVYMPGASLLSHKALWCVTRGIPVITTEEPRVGARLCPEHPKPVSLSPSEVDKLLHYGFNGVFDGDAEPSDILLAAIHCVHHCYRLSLTHDGARILVYGLAALAKLMLAACMAEARHVTRCQNIVDGWPGLTDLPWVRYFPHREGSSARRALSTRLFLGRTALRIARRTAEVFERLRWLRASYGGKAWYVITDETASLIKYLLDGNINAAAAKANTIISLEHNNSLVIDKYFGSSARTKLTDIGNGDWLTAIKALPGFAALCKPLLDESCYNDWHSFEPDSSAHRAGDAVLPAYYDRGTGPVISDQSIVVRNRDKAGEIAADLHQCLRVGLGSDRVAIRVVTLDKHGKRLGHRECGSVSAESDNKNGVWNLVEVVASNPVAYHSYDEVGIVINGEWHGCRVPMQGEVVYHLVGERNGMPVVIATPGKCWHRRRAARELSFVDYRDAVATGFGLNFNGVRMLTAYSAAFSVRYHKCYKLTRLSGIAYGMVLRYLFAMSLWVESMHTGQNRLADVLDVNLGVPGVALVPSHALFEMAIKYEPAKEILEGAIAPIAGWHIAPCVPAIFHAHAALRYLRDGDISLMRASLVSADIISPVLDFGHLSHRIFWDPWSVHCHTLDTRTTGVRKATEFIEYPEIHLTDLVHGLAMIQCALRGE